MTEESTYNGWTNRETWLVALWLGNTDAMTDEYTRYIANDKAYNLNERVDILRGYVYSICMGDESKKEPIASMATDLLNQYGWVDRETCLGDALLQVNFREIVENHIEEDYSPPWESEEVIDIVKGKSL
jgi:hypothetical protein